MCKIANTDLGIRKLDFSQRGKMTATLSDGRIVTCPLSMFPDIKEMKPKDRNDWWILDDQFFSFKNMTRVYAVTDLLKL